MKKARAAKKKASAKRGRGRPLVGTEPVERYNVTLPADVAAEIRDFGGGLSQGIVKAWQLMRERFAGGMI